MTEQAPDPRAESLSPFSDFALALRAVHFSQHDSDSELRQVLVRLQSTDNTGISAFSAALETCKHILEPQLYYRGIRTAGIYELHADPANKNATHVDLWTVCHVNDVRKYREILLDAQESIQPSYRGATRTKALAVAAAAIGVTLPFLLHHGSENKTTAPESSATQAHPFAQKLTKRPNPRRAPAVPHSKEAQHLSANLAQAQPELHSPAKPRIPRQPAVSANTFSIVTLNALGASHTDSPRGKAYGELPKSRERTLRAADFIANNHFGIVGLQEFQRPQRTTLLQAIGDRYDIFPTRADYHQHASENSIIWDQHRFNLQDSGYRTTRYFNGSEARMPWVLLFDTYTGRSQYILDTHDPADTRQFPNQAKWRAKDQQIHLSDVQNFMKSGLSTYLVGDFNSSACMLRLSGVLAEAIDIVTNQSSCPTKNSRIDHILVSNNVSVANVLLYKTTGITDHPKVEAAWVESTPAG